MAYGNQHIIVNTSNKIRGVRFDRYLPRLQHTPEASSGSVHHTAHHFQGQAPVHRFLSTDLQTLATLCSGNADAPCVAISDYTWHEALASGAAPGYVAGANHRKHALAAGVLAIDSISWRHGDHMLLGATAFTKSADGTTDPRTTTDNVSLPTPEIWTSGYRPTAATFDGGAVTTGCEGLQIDIDHRIENNIPGICRSLGLPLPTALAMAGTNGAVLVSGMIDLHDVTLAPSTGDLSITCTEVDSGGHLLSDTVVIAVNAEVVPVCEIGGESGRPRAVRCAFYGIDDGVNKQITITP